MRPTRSPRPPRPPARLALLGSTAILAACASAGTPAETTTTTADAAAATARDAPPRATTVEERAVIEVVQRFFDGMRTRDTTLMRSTVDENARLVGTRSREGQPFVAPPLAMREFITRVGQATGDPWIERIYDAEARVSANLATVWTPYTFHVGERFSHCGVDSFQLARFPAGWKIIHVADTYVTEGCPTTTPADR